MTEKLFRLHDIIPTLHQYPRIQAAQKMPFEMPHGSVKLASQRYAVKRKRPATAAVKANCAKMNEAHRLKREAKKAIPTKQQWDAAFDKVIDATVKDLSEKEGRK